MTEFLFGAFPYAAVLLAVGAGVYRYFSDRFSFTSHSTQLLARRLLPPRLLAVTTAMDWILLLVLLLQVASGVTIAWKYRWGSAWYLHTAVPWLGALVRLRPETAYAATPTEVAKFHLANAFVLVAPLPFP